MRRMASTLRGSSRNVLLISADTYSRYCDPHDVTTASLFGDAAAATLLTGEPRGALAEVGPTQPPGVVRSPFGSEPLDA